MIPPLVTLNAPWPEILGVRALPDGAVLCVGPGAVYRVLSTGDLDPVQQGGQPAGRSIASDPCARRRP